MNQEEVYEREYSDEPICGGDFEEGPICGGVIEEEIPIKKYTPISTFIIDSFVKDLDTLYIDELYCQDSSQFTQSFKNINIPPICIEAELQGNTYYSVQINKKGRFENFQVLRKASHFFDSVDSRVQQNLEEMQIISKEYFNTELFFYHKFRLI